MILKKTGDDNVFVSRGYESAIDGVKYCVQLRLKEKMLYVFRTSLGPRIWDQKTFSDYGLKRAAKECLINLGVQFEA